MSEEREEIPITLNYYQGAKRAIESLMDLMRVTEPQAVGRQALSDELFIQEKLSEGWTFYIKKDNEVRQIFWKFASRTPS